IKRNPLILDVLYRCKNVEKTGTGFKRVDEMCAKNGVRWDSRNSAYGFYFTFYRNKQQAAKVIETTERPKLSDIEMFVFTEIKNNPKITRAELSNTVGRSVRSIQRIANTLVEKGYLIRIGNNQFGYWEVVH
ncbi:MAG: winged helix-turn-helix transcriptional regulator, partial [Candidatus Enteromonas sp.]|nr:winged helix-turn-helix transcriptional regulator [Candidatus Enteromonas sp.]